MKLVYLLITLVFINKGLHAQTDLNVVVNKSYFDINTGSNFMSGFTVKSPIINNQIEGNYYLFNNWFQAAFVYDLENKGYKISNSNFNIKDNAIEVKLPTEEGKEPEKFIFDSDKISKFVFKNHFFVKKMIDDSGEKYFVEALIKEGNIKLYKYQYTEILEASFNKMTQKKLGKDKILIKYRYFIERNNGALNEIKLSKSGIIKALNNSTKLKQYIKENKLKMKKTVDFINVINYFNSI
ncbi:hypothetical protein [Neotamlana laminarinivorans]|uniref:Uncharacterized protein n=1 Tax=Neotamlana laminarinivorans TaxID=2883124 RepID=A0A9X1L208_9FLAO|nr:hypothetical protein [Tamlana laminarinivorans]MCB4799275.1 hypothetical protein [Tamlana laminarinivorans]